MLNDSYGFKKVYIATGYTDLRRGMEGLAGIIRFQFNLDPYDKNTLFFSVEDVPIVSKVFFGKAMDFYFFTSV